MSKTFGVRTIQRIKTFYTLNYLGLLVGFIGFFLALTPSLLPRPVLFLGIISGLGLIIGYGIGSLISSLLRWTNVREPSAQTKQLVWRASGAILAILIIVFGFQAAAWQNDVRDLIGEPHVSGIGVVRIVIISLITASLFLGLARSIRRGARRIKKQIQKISIIPKRIAAITSGVLMGTLVVLIFNGVIFNGFISLADSVYRSSNEGTAEGAVKSDSFFRSGGKDSLVSWDSLGRQGRNFIGRGPTTDEISAFTGRVALQPIRVYAGINSADTIQERADIVTKELVRTGAFDRKILVVMTATGSGWIEPQSSDAIEYMHDGDTALASIQYSYLPSWISLIAERKEATMAGKALFESVYNTWSKLPENKRPELIAYGLSLGSYGGQSTFSGANDLAKRTDGALFLGTPSFGQPSGYFTDNRDAGSPQYKPVYQKGEIVNFANTNADIKNVAKNWTGSRTLYVQYPSDPVVWWSPDLILHKPDWLREQHAADVSPAMHWYPFVTFLQVTVDQFFAGDVPSGTGHNYGATIAQSWASVTKPNNWSNEQTIKLQKLIDSKHTDSNDTSY